MGTALICQLTFQENQQANLQPSIQNATHFSESCEADDTKCIVTFESTSQKEHVNNVKYISHVLVLKHNASSSAHDTFIYLHAPKNIFFLVFVFYYYLLILVLYKRLQNPNIQLFF